MLLRSAFKFSKNAAAVNLCYKVGPNSVVRLARKFGIKDKLYNDCQNLTLGSSSIKLVELVNAYAVMLATGYVRTPIIVRWSIVRTRSLPSRCCRNALPS